MNRSQDKNPIGHCLCKSIQFRVNGPALFCVNCHCHYCRQAHGAAFVTWHGVKQDEFEYISGEDKLKWYQSSAASQRGFCTHCGSTLFFKSELCPGEIHIALPYLHKSIHSPPTAHVFYDQRADWTIINDDLTKVNTQDEQLSKYTKIHSIK